jgi:hypothetical protein
MVQYIVGVGIVLRNNLSWVVSEQPQNNIHRGGGGLWKTMKIRANARGEKENSRADLLEKILNSVYFITILHTNSDKLSTAPSETSAPYTYDNISMKNNLCNLYLRMRGCII